LLFGSGPGTNPSSLLPSSPLGSASSCVSLLRSYSPRLDKQGGICLLWDSMSSRYGGSATVLVSRICRILILRPTASIIANLLSCTFQYSTVISTMFLIGFESSPLASYEVLARLLRIEEASGRSSVLLWLYFLAYPPGSRLPGVLFGCLWFEITFNRLQCVSGAFLFYDNRQSYSTMLQ
jgi:hypothetical protein